MKTKRQYVWTAAIALAMFAGVAVADPLSDNATNKIAAAKVATDAVNAANDEVRTIIATQGDSASKYADASRELAEAKKAVSKADAATKPAAEQKVKDIDAKMAQMRKERADIDAKLKDAQEKYTTVRRASYPIVAEKTAAEVALAEKVATDRAAALKGAQDKANAAKAAVAKAKADKTAADKSCQDCVAKADAATKAIADKKDAAKVAAEKAAQDAAAKVAAAKKAMADKDAAVKNAEQALVAATAAVKTATDQKTAADKDLSAKKSADRVAIETVKGSNLYIAIKAKDDAVNEKNTAQQALTKASSAESSANSTYEAAKKAADAANAAKAPTDKALAAANAAKAEAKKAADAKTAAANTAVANAAATKAAADKANAEKAAAEKALAAAAADKKAEAKKDCDAKIAAAKTAGEAAAAAKKAADAANGAKAAAEKALAASETARVGAQKAADAKIAAANAATAKAAGAKAALDKAVAVATAARNTVAEKTKAIPPLQEKLALVRVEMQGGLKPMAGKDWTYAKARHLVVRAGFGGTPAEVQKVYEMGLHDAVDHFVEIYDQPVANIEFDPARLRRNEPWEGRLPWDERQYMTVKYRNPERAQQAEMRHWWLQRMAESPRPLQEKMALFWHDHFAVQYQKNYRTSLLFQQNQLFRTYGVDNYGALLRGIVHDPAMISYLDNNVNYKGSGNENLGREILELFSMGVGSGYTEDDIREASRALTGYNYDSWTDQFRNIATRHDLEPKKILGSTGNWSGDDLVDIILRQPATAKYISEKIFKFLAHDEPYDETVEKMAEVMRYSSYDLRPVLSNLFLSEEFYSDKSMGTHIKGPAELAIGAIRDLGIQDANYGVIDAAINQMGQVLFEPPNVAGWNEGRTWINAERILIRYNQMARILESPNVDLVELLKNDKVDTSEKVVDQLVKACLVVKPDPEKCKALAAFLGKLPPQSEWDAKKNEVNAKLRAVLVLLMSSPDSQLG